MRVRHQNHQCVVFRSQELGLLNQFAVEVEVALHGVILLNDQHGVEHKDAASENLGIVAGLGYQIVQRRLIVQLLLGVHQFVALRIGEVDIVEMVVEIIHAFPEIVHRQVSHVFTLIEQAYHFLGMGFHVFRLRSPDGYLQIVEHRQPHEKFIDPRCLAFAILAHHDGHRPHVEAAVFVELLAPVDRQTVIRLLALHHGLQLRQY